MGLCIAQHGDWNLNWLNQKNIVPYLLRHELLRRRVAPSCKEAHRDAREVRHHPNPSGEVPENGTRRHQGQTQLWRVPGPGLPRRLFLSLLCCRSAREGSARSTGCWADWLSEAAGYGLSASLDDWDDTGKLMPQVETWVMRNNGYYWSNNYLELVGLSERHAYFVVHMFLSLFSLRFLCYKILLLE